MERLWEKVGKGKDVEEWPFWQIYKDKVFFFVFWLTARIVLTGCI